MTAPRRRRQEPQQRVITILLGCFLLSLLFSHNVVVRVESFHQQGQQQQQQPPMKRSSIVFPSQQPSSFSPSSPSSPSSSSPSSSSPAWSSTAWSSTWPISPPPQNNHHVFSSPDKTTFNHHQRILYPFSSSSRLFATRAPTEDILVDEEEEGVYKNDDDEDDEVILEEEVAHGSSSEDDDGDDDDGDHIDDDDPRDDVVTPFDPMRRSSSPTTAAKLSLSQEQEQALEHIRQGDNVFLTGVAGTGKSLVLRAALTHLAKTYKPKEYVAVAPTGAAAVTVEGQTIHSFASIGIPRTFKDFEKSKRNKATAKHWRALKVMVIDEVSMVSGEFFDNLSAVVSDIRKDPRPFGGIQLVVCGDFLQLSPIAPRKAEVDQIVGAMLQNDQNGQYDPDEEQRVRDLLFLNRGFCFQSIAWKEAQFQVMELQEVFRQRDRDFVNALQDIRQGRVTPETMQYLRKNCERPLPPIGEYGIRPTILHSKNINVNRENLVDLNKLPGETVFYQAMDEVEVEKGVGKWAIKPLENCQFFKNCIAEMELQLKIGAQVMLIKNMNRDSRLVNGSRGTVIGFRTIKSARNSKKAELLHLLPGVDRYPVVQFVNGLQQVITPQKFQSRLVGMGTCTRTAVPLKLAWAITTHKAQGLTLDYVIADVGQVFAEAQLYVALSRASDATGLELRNFSTNRVRANPVAMKFHQDPDQDFPFWWEIDGRDRSDPPPSMMNLLADKESSPKTRQTKKSTTAAKSKKNEGNVDAALRSSIDAKDGSPPNSPRRASSMLQGKIFVFAGVLQGISIEDAEALVKKHGGLIRQSVSIKTDFLVLGKYLKNGKLASSGAQCRSAKGIIEKQKEAFVGKDDGKFQGLRILKEESFLKVLRR